VCFAVGPLSPSCGGSWSGRVERLMVYGGRTARAAKAFIVVVTVTNY